jgi:hypothetical protein
MRKQQATSVQGLKLVAVKTDCSSDNATDTLSDINISNSQ